MELKMKQVKVYVISETVKAVAGNFVEFYESPQYGVPDAHIYTRDASGFSEPDEKVALKAGFKRLPSDIHRYRTVDGAETFFALRPDVAELLATPASLDVVARARSEAGERARRMQESENRALARMRNTADALFTAHVKVGKFMALPWPLRVWHALRGRI